MAAKSSTQHSSGVRAPDHPHVRPGDSQPGSPGSAAADRPSTDERPSRSRPSSRPIRAAQARADGPWAKTTSTRRAASRARGVWSPAGQDIWLCSLATSGTCGGRARAAVRQAPTMRACTRLALVGDPDPGALQRCPASGYGLVVQEHVHDAAALTGEGRQATGTDTAALRRSDPWSAPARSAAWSSDDTRHRARYGWSSGLIRRGVPVEVVARLLTHRCPAASSQTCIRLDATGVAEALTRAGVWNEPTPFASPPPPAAAAEHQDGHAEQAARQRVDDLEQHPASQPSPCPPVGNSAGQQCNRVSGRHSMVEAVQRRWRRRSGRQAPAGPARGRLVLRSPRAAHRARPRAWPRPRT